MGLELVEVFKQSMTYKGLSRIREWTEKSTVVRLINDERVLITAIVIFLLLSLGRVLTSSMDAPVKFLSFALLFVVIIALTWNYTDPFVST